MADMTLNIIIVSRTNVRLTELATRIGRDTQSVAAEAIEAFLDVSDWQIAGVRKALASRDAGRGVAH